MTPDSKGPLQRSGPIFFLPQRSPICGIPRNWLASVLRRSDECPDRGDGREWRTNENDDEDPRNTRKEAVGQPSAEPKPATKAGIRARKPASREWRTGASCGMGNHCHDCTGIAKHRCK